MMYTPLRFKQMNRQVHSRYSDVQDVLSKTLYDIACYSIYGFIIGALLEYVFPKYDEDISESKDVFLVLLEVFMQVIVIVFAFMFIATRGGGRYGLLVYILFMVGTQPSLFNKMEMLYQKILGDVKKPTPVKIKQKNTTPVIIAPIKKKPQQQVKNNTMSTSLEDLPTI